MERLTEKLGSGQYAIIRSYEKDALCTAGMVIDRLAAYEDTGLTPEEVKEHEAAYIELMTRTYGPLHQKIGQWLQADQDGRLVVLPCKIGDTVYRVFHPGGCAPAIIERNVQTLEDAVSMIGKMGSHLLVDTYLTRQEAEAALEQLKGGGGT